MTSLTQAGRDRSRRTRDDRCSRLPPSRRHYARWVVPLAGVVVLAVVLPPLARADPPADYILNCRGCHGPDGNGVPGGAPTFRGQVGKFLWVPGGREYLIRVPGTAQSELDDARIAALLNWIVRTFSASETPADFAPFTSEEVAHYRHTPLAEVATARRDLLRAIAAREAAGTGAAR